MTNERRHLLGGTDAATILGLGRESPLALFVRLRDGVQPDEEGQAAMAAGKLAEDALLRPLIEQATGWKLKRAESMCLPDEPRIGASPDFYVDVGGGPGAKVEFAEAKLTGSRAMWGPPGTREVPVHVAAQVQQQMAVARAVGFVVPVVHVSVCFVPGFVMSVYPVPEDQEAGALLLAAERTFLHRLDTNQPPEAGSEADARIRFLASRGTPTKLSEAGLESLLRVHLLREEIKERMTELERAQFNVLSEAKEATELLHPVTGKLVGTVRANRVFDEALLRAQFPELVDQFTVPTLDREALRKRKKVAYDACMRDPVTVQEQKRVLKVIGAEAEE